MLKFILALGSVTAVLAGGVGYAHQVPPQPSPIKRTPLGKVEVPGSNYEVVFGITELPAGFKSGRHSHPGLVMAYAIPLYVGEKEFRALVSERLGEVAADKATAEAALAAIETRLDAIEARLDALEGP